jgi:hypothetical protein
LVFTPTSALLFSKTTSLINLLRSGQLQAKKGGQFGAKIYGQLPAESSDLFKRNFQFAIISCYQHFISFGIESNPFFIAFYHTSSIKYYD